ncbi:hypothetical protein KDW_21140 [Dictyobacter vulcani]|uniref:histidine kinase n=1 Tax=Dictyobacter vulcani TaxID=2607529 RepID=A0A5J4KLJ0_9CHLR|nr:hybrid sensor histidine kinase/response regulator [Dictyobacter vulcani]GER87952.1 hypothetical protein KDW_21140 [Dictyobacter vulcani]
MNELNPPFDENELTTEDLAILNAFDAIDSWPDQSEVSDSSVENSPARSHQQVDDGVDEDAEMLIVFLEEAGEDIARMQYALTQMTQATSLTPVRFTVFQRAGHKLRGTAGAVGYDTMSIVAEHIEIIAEQILQQGIEPAIGQQAITRAVAVLEHCHSYLLEEGQEPDNPTILTTLEATYQSLGINLVAPPESETVNTKITIPLEKQADNPATSNGEELLTDIAGTSSSVESSSLFMHIETRRFERLRKHSEQLIELHPTLESAQRDVKTALQAQQAAQIRLHQLEQGLSNALLNRSPGQPNESQTSSSLIARILNTVQQDTAHPRKTRNRSQLYLRATESNWDELDMERYTEQDLLLRSLREAINQMAICSARVNATYTALQIAQQEYMARATVIRSDTQMLRLTPLSKLVPLLQRVISTSALAQQYKLEFAVIGDSLEIDQEILETLATPLQHMLFTCISDTSVIQEEQAEVYHVWLRALSDGNDITLEIGFSMPVLGGTLEILQKPLQKLNGSINLQRNNAGGVSFHLSIPRSRGTVQCMVLRSENQQFIVPIAQLRRVSSLQQEQLDSTYHLKDLLGVSNSATTEPARQAIQPVMVIQSATDKTHGILVDEIVAERELMLKPLPAFLQRPGITESAIDGQGNVLLMLDLYELLRQYKRQSTLRNPDTDQEESTNIQQQQSSQTPKVLVADDSTYLRQAVLLTLQKERYEIFEARDGMEAIEQLLENTPDIFLLDIEMPNLNGYDVLNIIREYPELAHVKTIMLTSRSSDKHVQRARELGAQAYLVKPCAQETLLSTIRTLLQAKDSQQ